MIRTSRYEMENSTFRFFVDFDDVSRRIEGIRLENSGTLTMRITLYNATTGATLMTYDASAGQNRTWTPNPNQDYLIDDYNLGFRTL